MRTKPRLALVLLSTVTILAAASGCIGTGPRVRVGPLQEETQTVKWDGVEPVRVAIEMGAGELSMSGGAADLLDAEFLYNVAAYKPEVAYSDGRLTIKQPDTSGRASLFDVDDYRYEWNLLLAEDVPMEITIDLGAGQADLDLGDLSLTSLDLDAGAGEVTIDLAGATALSDLMVGMGAGEITLDLTGDRSVDLDAKIDGGVGQATIMLPRATGVRVHIDGGLGEIEASGFTRDGDSYVNGAYGETEFTIDIDIDGGVGKIELRLED